MLTSNLVMLSGQSALQNALDVIANNVANANTTGFKREGVSFSSHMSRSAGVGGTAFNFAAANGTFRDISNGPITQTSNPLDVALQGQGYMQVQMPDGKTGYTRAGALQLNAQGQIVTQSGMPILDQGSQAITVPETTSQINISGDGAVTARVNNGADLAQLGKIAVVKFDNEQNMTPTGNGVYTTTQLSAPTPDTVIVQGAIEQSNVEPVREITAMIDISRAYERIANLISMTTDNHTSGLDKLAKSTV